jgi:thiol:disulfide interchange protein DsbD
LDDSAAALAQAQRDGRWALVDFRADWCASCLQLERSVWPHPDVARAAAPFVTVRVDMTGQESACAQLAAEWGVESLPAVVFVDPQGRVLSQPRVQTALSPRALAKILKTVPRG